MKSALRGLICLACCLAPFLAGALPARAQEPAAPGDRGPLSLVGVEGEELLVELVAPEPQIALVAGEDGAGRAQVEAQGFSPSGPAGAPALPAATAWVVVPHGARVSLEILRQETEVLALPAPPLPVPSVEPAWGPTGELLGSQLRYREDPAHYGAALYPASLCELAADVQLREWRLVQVRCTPYQYRPAERSLLVTRRALLRLQAGPLPPAGLLAQAEGPFTAALSRAVLNPQHLASLGQVPALRALAVPEPPGRLRICVAAGDGIYAAAFEQLRRAGLPENLPTASLRLSLAGEEVPIGVEELDADGLFGPGERILFYGEERESPYGTENCYWLDWGAGEGKRLQGRSVSGPEGAAPGKLYKTIPLRNYDPRYPDPWRSDWTDIFVYSHVYSPVAEDGHFYAGILQARQPAEMPDREWFAASTPDAAPGEASFTLNLLGVTEGQHRVELAYLVTSVAAHSRLFLPLVLSGASTATGQQAQAEPPYTELGAASWQGAGPVLVSHSVPASDGLTIVRLTLPGSKDESGNYRPERALIARPQLTYPVALATEGALVATGEKGPRSYEVQGFRAVPRAWDVTDPRNPMELGGFALRREGNTYAIAFADEAAEPRVYAFADEQGLKSPSAIEAPEPFLAAGAPAQYLIIAPKEFLPAAQALAAHRRAQDGLSTAIITVQAIYDRFSYGMLDPEAIRQCVRLLYESWAQGGAHTLQYVLLLGDGSYDFKNRLNHGLANFIPPYLAEDLDPHWGGQAGSDHLFANERGVPPSVLVGRIPVRSLEEAQLAVDKLIAYETGRLGPPARKLLFAADDPHLYADIGAEPFRFDALAEGAIASLLGSGLAGEQDIVRIYQTSSNPPEPGYYYSDDETDTQELLSRWRAGVAVLYYAGHSHYWGWATPKLLRTEDIAAMGPTPLALAASMTCFTGVFYHPNAPSLDEALLVAPDRGLAGAISPFSMGSPIGHRQMQGRILSSLLSEGTLGEAMLAGKLALDTTQRDLIDTYGLLGDPATRLTLGTPVTAGKLYLPLVLNAAGG